MKPRGRTLRRSVQIVNRKGLHARAAAKFAQAASALKAEITVTRGDTTVSGRSIMGLMMLAAACGTSIDITAGGTNAAAALDILGDLVAGGFGEGSA